MSNTSPLTEYLVSGRYESEINDTNPLGMRGEMAKAFADLIKQIWSTKSGAVIPRAFKVCFGKRKFFLIVILLFPFRQRSDDLRLSLVAISNKIRRNFWLFFWMVCTKI